jgi:hypothetical protein
MARRAREGDRDRIGDRYCALAPWARGRESNCTGWVRGRCNPRELDFRDNRRPVRPLPEGKAEARVTARTGDLLVGLFTTRLTTAPVT